MIFGITGTLGAGKGTVVDYLVNKKGFKHYAVSDDFLADEAQRRGLVADRVTRRNIANEYRAKSPMALMETVYQHAREKIGDGGDLVIDPQHTKAEVEFIKEKGGVMLAIDANLETRYGRICKRGSAKDQVTYEEFITQQTKEMASANPDENNLAAAIEAADYHLLNNGTLEELNAQIEEVLSKIKKF